MKIKNFVGKVTFSTESEKFVGNRGKCETEGNASLPEGGRTSLLEARVPTVLCLFSFEHI